VEEQEQEPLIAAGEFGISLGGDQLIGLRLAHIEGDAGRLGLPGAIWLDEVITAWNVIRNNGSAM
jgi:hypothetical protein